MKTLGPAPDVPRKAPRTRRVLQIWAALICLQVLLVGVTLGGTRAATVAQLDRVDREEQARIEQINQESLQRFRTNCATLGAVWDGVRLAILTATEPTMFPPTDDPGRLAAEEAATAAKAKHRADALAAIGVRPRPVTVGSTPVCSVAFAP